MPNRHNPSLPSESELSDEQVAKLMQSAFNSINGTQTDADPAKAAAFRPFLRAILGEED